MKHKKLFVLLFIMIFVSIGIFSIYKITYKEEFNYVALGDSVAAGRNPYGVEDYGYTDYISDYLKKENKLKSYVNFAVSGYTTEDVNNDINYNKNIKIDNKEINIKKALRESDLVTISIGANDFLGELKLTSIPSLLEDKNYALKRINSIFDSIDTTLELVMKYAKGTIIVVGYYNPLPYLEKYEDQINEIVDYADQKYQELCDKHDIYYVKVSDEIAKNKEYLPNPLDIHPSKKGYEVISKEIVEVINREMLN